MKKAAPQKHTLEVYLNSIDQVVKKYKLNNYFLAGASFGGLLAIEYMYKNPNGIKALILFSPLTKPFTKSKLGNVIRISRNQFQNWKVTKDPLTQNVFTYKHLRNIKNKLEHSSFILNLKFNEKYIPKEIPILVVLGEKDYVIDTKYTKKVFENYKNAKIFTFPDKGHDAFATMGEKILDLLIKST